MDDAARRLRDLGDLLAPMAIRVAATLRLPDLIAEGATTAEALAARARADRDALDRLLRHLVTIGLLARDGERYVLTELGEALRPSHPGSPAGALDIHGVVGHIELAYTRLLDAVLTGRAAYPLVHGAGFWEHLAGDAELSARFDRHMGSGDVGPAVGAYSWAAVRHVVDVGGGTGSLLAGILRAEPGLRGTLVELGGPASAAKERFAAEGLAGRTDVVAGSFFDPLPAGAGVYVLSNVLHDWPDRDAEAILRQCALAARPDGRVVVFDGVLDPAGDPGMSGFDLMMLVCFGGRQRTLADFQALGAASGLRLAATSPVDESFGHLMEFRVVGAGPTSGSPGRS